MRLPARRFEGHATAPTEQVEFPGVEAYTKKGNPLSEDRGRESVQNLVGKSDVGRAKIQ